MRREGSFLDEDDRISINAEGQAIWEKARKWKLDNDEGLKDFVPWGEKKGGHLLFLAAVIGIRTRGKKVEEFRDKEHMKNVGSQFLNADTENVVSMYVKALHTELPADGTFVRRKMEDYIIAGLLWLESFMDRSPERDKIDVGKLVDEISEY